MQTVSTGTGSGPDTFDVLVRTMQVRYDALASADPRRLFATDAGDLFAVYLEHLPPEQRQYHTCSCCRTFLKRFGGLAAIDARGTVAPALWEPESAPEPYRAAVVAMAKAVRAAPITAPFLASDAVWGSPEAGGWTHFAVRPEAGSRYLPGTLTARQAMAARREDFRTLSRALGEFDRDTVARALTLLKAEALYRAEKVIGPATFLLDLHDAIGHLKGPAATRGPLRDNLIWRAIATAPPGFCTPRGAMVGTLLDDIAAGMPFGNVKRRFDAKMHPLLYQRPQAAPKAGTIAQAEKLVAELGLEPALHRRYARLAEIPALWRPTPEPEAAGRGGVFGHLAAKGDAAPPPLDMPAQAITWVKFARTVLPTARRMAVFTEPNMNLCGLVTALHPDAPPILQWDRAEARNPVSWYVYHGGSSPEEWGLPRGAWVDVAAAVLQPSLWADEDAFPHQGKNALLVLAGARDQREPGLCLFPETLRSDLHGIRAVVEAYSRTRQIQGREESDANGLVVGRGDGRHRIRVTDATGTACYRIDRWD
ncbi:hypothetical protein ACLBX9_16785 [Methylobacterium sp. A49B]